MCGRDVWVFPTTYLDVFWLFFLNKILFNEHKARTYLVISLLNQSNSRRVVKYENPDRQRTWSTWVCSAHSTKSFHITWLPSGELTFCHGKIHPFSWENPLFLWPFSIAMLVYRRVVYFKEKNVQQTMDSSVIFFLEFSHPPSFVAMGQLGNPRRRLGKNIYKSSIHCRGLLA